jgi:hypothetical protein
MLLAGCDADVTINTDFAKLRPGLINSGLEDNGALYIIDTKEKRAQLLETIDTSSYPVAKSRSTTTMIASNLTGFDFSISGVDVKPDQKAEVSAAIQRETKLALTKFEVEQLRQPWQVIVDNISNRVPSDAADPWRLSEATNSRRFIYILIYGGIRAEEVKFTAGDKEDSDGSGLTIKVGAVNAKIKFLNRGYVQWQGAGTAAIVKYYAFRVTTKNGKYRISRVSDPADLSAILRGS